MRTLIVTRETIYPIGCKIYYISHFPNPHRVYGTVVGYNTYVLMKPDEARVYKALQLACSEIHFAQDEEEQE